MYWGLIISDFSNFKMEDLEISNRLISRRNKVYKIKFRDTNLPAILKVYPSENELSNEYINLKKLSKLGITVPNVLSKSNKCLILEHISGDLVNDLAEKQNLGSWIDKLANGG